MLLFTSSTTGVWGRAERPNVVLIYADDLGYGDLSCYGGEGRISTPNIDRLAAEGCRFTQAYTAASVCSPARYSLLTGRYPWRTWLKSGVVGNTPALIDPETFTLGDLFKSAGYKTAAIGKWHIGFGDRGQKDLDWNAEIPKGPREVGFDYFFGMPVSHFYPPFVYIENRAVYQLDPHDPLSLVWPEGGGMPTQRGGNAATYDKEKAGRELADRACRYIEENSDGPFFLYYAAIEPHTPFTPHPDYTGKSDAGLYGDFVVQFDDGVGRILKTLEKEGIADDTIVILTSDNGGIATSDGHLRAAGIRYNPNVPLRGDKGDALEGGLRIPFIIRWPGVVKAGTVSEEVICQTDLLAAFADLLGVPIPNGAAEDSRNILRALKGGAAPDTPIVLQSRAGFHSLRAGEWIFLDVSNEGDFDSKVDVGTPGQLYHLPEDLRQEHNLYAKHPERVEEMRASLEKVRSAHPATGEGSTLALSSSTPINQHLGWNDAVWGDPAVEPAPGNHYVFDREKVWLHGLSQKYGGFDGDSLSLLPGSTLMISGGGPLETLLILKGGQLQIRVGETAAVSGDLRVDSDSSVLMVAGSLELQTTLSGLGDMKVGALREPGCSFVFDGEAADYRGQFILADAGADNVRLMVEFRKTCPLARLTFEAENEDRLPVLLLGGDLAFREVSLPAANGGLTTLPAGTYRADDLIEAGVLAACFKDRGGSIAVGAAE